MISVRINKVSYKARSIQHVDYVREVQNVRRTQVEEELLSEASVWRQKAILERERKTWQLAAN